MISINVRKNLFTVDGFKPLTVNISIDKNDFFTFYGPSGAGKTTTLRMLAGLTIPDSGEIIIDGKTWFNSEKKINIPVKDRKIGFVFQDYALFPSMNVRKNLEYACKDIRRVNSLIEVMKLGPFEKSKPSELSGGQRQRVALARALVHSPDILLLDEPLSALDHTMRKCLQDEIAMIHKSFGLTSIIVTHDITEIFHLSNNMACFDHGHVTQRGSPDSVFSRTTSNKFRVAGTVLQIKSTEQASVITVQVGNTLTSIVVDIAESGKYHTGQQVIVAAKAFAPVILPVE